MISVGNKRRVLYASAVALPLALLFAWAFDARVRRVGEARRDFRSVVYSKAFQQRFSLPQAGVYELDPGLHAIALRVITVPFWEQNCFLDVYVDSTLDLDYPPGTSGRYGDDWVYGLMFFAADSPDSDSAAHRTRWLDGGPRWMIRSTGYRRGAERHGIIADGPLDAYDRDILPGLSVVTIHQTSAALTTDHGPAQLWLRRRGQPQIDERAPNPEHAYGFSIPETLLRHAAQAVSHAGRFRSYPLPSGEPKYVAPARSAEDGAE